MNVTKFIDALLEEVIIDNYFLDFGTEYYEGYYLCRNSAYYTIAQIVPKTYFSHRSALHLWRLTDKGSCMFINREQAPALSKAVKRKLEQSAITNVFNLPKTENKIHSFYLNNIRQY